MQTEVNKNVLIMGKLCMCLLFLTPVFMQQQIKNMLEIYSKPIHEVSKATFTLRALELNIAVFV